MGITCKVTGKMKGILRKIDNENENKLKSLKEKKNKKNNQQKKTDFH